MIERRKTKRKTWWKSLTLWVNSMSGVIIAVLIAAQENLVMLKDWFTPEAYQLLLFGLVLVNIALRFKTTSAIGTGKERREDSAP
jgi:hypothetical protein